MAVRFSYSFPGKVILFGEHAVVHGEMAVAAAITKRMYANCNFYPSEKTLIKVNDLIENKIITFNPLENIPNNEQIAINTSTKWN